VRPDAGGGRLLGPDPPRTIQQPWITDHGPPIEPIRDGAGLQRVRGLVLQDGLFASGAEFPELFISPRNCVTRGHPTRTRPHAPPHPMGRFPHPQTHVGHPPRWVGTHQWAYMAFGMGGQNGCPAGNLRGERGMGKIAETALHEDTPLELSPTPHHTPWGSSSTPRCMFAVLLDRWGPTDERIGSWGRWPKWVSCKISSTTFLRWPIPGVSIPHHFLPIDHSAEVLHQPMDQIIGINQSDKVAPPQAPPMYTKMVGNVLNTTIIM
jgi:hypothetical protein